MNKLLTTKTKCAKSRKNRRTVCPHLVECDCLSDVRYGCRKFHSDELEQDDWGEALRLDRCKVLKPDGISQ